MIEKYKKRYYAMKAVEGGEYATKLLDEIQIKYSLPLRPDGGEPKRIFAVPYSFDYRCAYLCKLLGWKNIFIVISALELLSQYHLCDWDEHMTLLVMPAIYDPDVYERKANNE